MWVMSRRSIILWGVLLLGIIAIFLPAFSKLQRLKGENRVLEKEIAKLKDANVRLEEEIYKLETDPIYVEKVAREKLKQTKEGEIIYRTE